MKCLLTISQVCTQHIILPSTLQYHCNKQLGHHPSKNSLKYVLVSFYIYIYIYKKKKKINNFFGVFHSLGWDPSNWAFALSRFKSQIRPFNSAWEIRRSSELLWKEKTSTSCTLEFKFSDVSSDAITKSKVYVFSDSKLHIIVRNAYSFLIYCSILIM